MLGCTDLNTSYVLIYLIEQILKKLEGANLNTSYVLIYPAFLQQAQQSELNLNTSYVLIYRQELINAIKQDLFKYILCSYLSTTDFDKATDAQHLNTSYVLIYLFANPSRIVFTSI